MLRNVTLAALLAAYALLAPAAARDQGYPAAPLLSTGQNVVGETLRYPASSPAHVTAAIVTLAGAVNVAPDFGEVIDTVGGWLLPETARTVMSPSVPVASCVASWLVTARPT